MSLTGNVESKRELQGSMKENYTLAGRLAGLEKIQGHSAYEVAVINGFIGTEEEWLASLVPTRGEDYWTEDDQKSIVEDVLANFTDVSEVAL